MSLSSPYTNNTQTLAPLSTVGFKISKPGYDANTTQGSNMVFDSSWPSLPIAFQTTIDNPLTGGVTAYTVKHNLKFPPLTFIWFYGPDASGKTGIGMRLLQSVDATNVYLDTATMDIIEQAFVATAIRVNIKSFQLDISSDIDYILAPGDTFNRPYDTSFGIKIVKQGKDINSNDLRDFALHSRAQSPLILAVKTEKTSTTAGVVQYQSNLKYPAWVYGYIKKSTGIYTPAPYYAQAYPRTFTDGILSYIQYIGMDIGASIVVLRDPMFAATQVTVQY